MAQNFPKDVFDAVTDAGGRHRAKRTATSRLVSFSRYAAVTVVLSAASIAVLNFTSDSSVFNGSVSSNNSAQQQSFNSNGVGVTVVDTTETKGLAGKVAQSLYDSGWNVLSAVNAYAPGATQQTMPDPAGGLTPIPLATTAPKTIVYAVNDTAKSAAQNLLKTLGNYEVVVAATYADPITVVIGSDYR